MIEQGQIYWLKEPLEVEKANSIKHPQVVIQHTAINESRIDTVVVCGISTNMARAFDVGNVLLTIGEAGLEKESFVAVGQVSVINKSQFGTMIGKLENFRVQEILDGIMFRARRLKE
ncbi:MAG: hypothetical protein A2015_16785 [Spirochaetes bacterium GWF1_31_7]|nr:MAG: hypothetical protein A2Y30_14150 [Spirochaetes bacterium GWE1_32_154]OHD50099.1 MAG: hypothetical protein A2Y29_12195 [Spirochaetes bacterium GWE2_31_10]OHD52412.1 MAG: hypothetical protein A2015_16785 [Spirochaetes bacterium GWF1_31_7]OHD74313.1 MAG: hypothetical protein A2355_12135 [Spirochaetes bacterium RIFOXYB1_FULL_32_8]HBD96056.1 type II toxin-antitoxin system PemK/MazF family toxin [Spirochaetia bacterium]